MTVTLSKHRLKVHPRLVALQVLAYFPILTVAGYSSDDQATTSSPSRLPKELTRRLPPRKTRGETTRSVKGAKRAKRARRHAPVNELPLVATLEEGFFTQEQESDERITKAIGLAADPVETCTQAGTTPRKPSHNYADSRRLSVPKPLSTIQKSLRLAKDNSINPRDFKIPPQTPVHPKTTSWRLGSGFKNREKPNGGRKKDILSGNEKPAKPSSPQKMRTRQSGLDDIEGESVVSLQGAMNQQKPRIRALRDSAPTTNLTQPALHQTATKNHLWASELMSHAEQSNISTRLTTGPAPEPKRAGWHLPVRDQVVQNRTADPTPREGSILPPEVWPVTFAPALPTPPKQDSLPMPKSHAGHSSTHATARLKTAFDAPASRSDADQWFATRASPLRRGTSFVMTARVEPKGNLDLRISPRLKRMASLPFKPPIKGINCTTTAAASSSGASC
ncbi:MAG: hypothetical protein Q9207_004152 [Kuettlingeria erythrocarpa]